MGSIKRNTQIDFYNKVVDLLKEVRKSVVQTVNKTMVYAYFEIGKIYAKILLNLFDIRNTFPEINN